MAVLYNERMTTFVVTRHSGALEWMADKGFINPEIRTHFDVSEAQEGDYVVGTLPINLVADLCEKGVEYYHLVLNVPAELRGTEISAEVMNNLGATITKFTARQG